MLSRAVNAFEKWYDAGQRRVGSQVIDEEGEPVAEELGVWIEKENQGCGGDCDAMVGRRSEPHVLG